MAIYLFWMRTGLSQVMIAAYFDNDNLTQQNIDDYCEQIRIELEKSMFLSDNLGAKTLTRAQWFEHNTTFTRVYFTRTTRATFTRRRRVIPRQGF